MPEDVDQMDAANEVVNELCKDFDPADMPGNGDLADAIARAGYKLVKED